MSPELLLVAVAAVPIAALCRRYGLSAPLVLVTVGLAVGWIPGMPEVMLEPDLVLFLILPPLLYSAAQDSSYQAIRANRRAIGLLAVGLPLFTTLVVGLVAYWTVPNLPLAAATGARCGRRAARRGVGAGDRAASRVAASDHDAAGR